MRIQKAYWYLLYLLPILAVCLTACGDKERQLGIDGWLYLAEEITLPGQPGSITDFRERNGYLYYRQGNAVYRVEAEALYHGGKDMLHGEEDNSPAEGSGLNEEDITPVNREKDLPDGAAVFTGRGGSLCDYTLDSDGGICCVMADVAWTEKLVITDEEIRKYGCNVSFVGSLYSDNVYDRYLKRFPATVQQIFTEMMEESAFQWDGRDRLGERLTPELATLVKNTCPELYTRPYELSDEYYLKGYFFGRKLTHIERALLLQLLAGQYDIHLYTRNDDIVPEGIRRFPEVSQMTGAFKVFYSSKINLNITLRSIESGIPLRIFDIMSVGGFVLTNYQEEIPDLFAEGKEIVTFKTPEELIDKADYYLKHDTKRINIGINGYKKVKKCYTYEHQLQKIISILFPSP
jgi:spore maturation protein CgeB